MNGGGTEFPIRFHVSTIPDANLNAAGKPATAFSSSSVNRRSYAPIHTLPAIPLQAMKIATAPSDLSKPEQFWASAFSTASSAAPWNISASLTQDCLPKNIIPSFPDPETMAPKELCVSRITSSLQKQFQPYPLVMIG
jgi:hypothetical protein